MNDNQICRPFVYMALDITYEQNFMLFTESFIQDLFYTASK